MVSRTAPCCSVSTNSCMPVDSCFGPKPATPTSMPAWARAAVTSEDGEYHKQGVKKPTSKSIMGYKA